MNAQKTPFELRQRMGRAIYDYMLHHAASDVARLLCLSPSTVSRDRMGWGDDPSRWPVCDVLEMARSDDGPQAAAIAQVMSEWIGDSSAESSPMQALPRSMDLIARMGSTIAALMSAVQDGRIDRAEAKTMLPLIRSIHETSCDLAADLIRISEGG